MRGDAYTVCACASRFSHLAKYLPPTSNLGKFQSNIYNLGIDVVFPSALEDSKYSVSGLYSFKLCACRIAAFCLSQVSAMRRQYFRASPNPSPPSTYSHNRDEAAYHLSDRKPLFFYHRP